MHAKVVEALLEFDADVSIADRDMNEALHYAAMYLFCLLFSLLQEEQRFDCRATIEKTVRHSQKEQGWN